MLTCHNDEIRLPQNDLAYVGFRLSVLETLCQMETCQELNDGDTFGYLAEVPFLEQVAPAVQVDLLADVWKRHRDTALHEASLLDAAVVYAAFRTAGRVISDELSLARLWLKAGPQQVRCKLGSRTHQRLDALFFEFWDDIDFLSISELQDLAPEHAKMVREVMQLADGTLENMEDVFMRCRASPGVLANLRGLLTGEEIQGYGRLLMDSR